MPRGKTKQVTSTSTSEVQGPTDAPPREVATSDQNARQPEMRKPKASQQLSMFESEMLMEWSTS